MRPISNQSGAFERSDLLSLFERAAIVEVDVTRPDHIATLEGRAIQDLPEMQAPTSSIGIGYRE